MSALVPDNYASFMVLNGKQDSVIQHKEITVVELLLASLIKIDKFISQSSIYVYIIFLTHEIREFIDRI